MSSRAFRLAVKLLLLPLARAALHEAVAEDCGGDGALHTLQVSVSVTSDGADQVWRGNERDTLQAQVDEALEPLKSSMPFINASCSRCLRSCLPGEDAAFRGEASYESCTGRCGQKCVPHGLPELPDYFHEGISGPGNVTHWSGWILSLHQLRQQLKLGWSQESGEFSSPEFQRSSKAYVTVQTMVHDRNLYDPIRHDWTAAHYLKDLKSRFGGVDQVLLWAGYPNLGVDTRSNLDLMESVPGGMRTAVEALKKADPSLLVQIAYKPWDILTNGMGEDDPKRYAQLMASSKVDGLNLDTMDSLGPYMVAPGQEKPVMPVTDFFRAAQEAGVRAIIEPELGLYGGLFLLNATAQGWLYTLAQCPPVVGCSEKTPFVPLVSVQKFLARGSMPHVCGRWSTQRSQEILTAYFNAIGYTAWENIFGIWNGISERDGELLKRATMILRHFHDLLSDPEVTWLPFYPVKALSPKGEHIYVSKFVGKDQELFLMINTALHHAGDEDWILPVPDAKHEEFFDVYRGADVRHVEHGHECLIESCTTRAHTTKTRLLRVPMEARGIGAILKVRSGEITPAHLGLFREMGSATDKPLHSFSEEVLPVKQKSDAGVAGSKPSTSGMVAVKGGPFEFRVVGSIIEDTYHHGKNFVKLGVDVQYEWEDVPVKYHKAHNTTIKDLWVDKHPVTNEQYAAFLRESFFAPAGKDYENFLKHWRCPKPDCLDASLAKQPVVFVSHWDAEQYCVHYGKRLPREWEWQYVAQAGDPERSYPWGQWWWPDAMPPAQANASAFHLGDVGRFPNGSSKDGVEDLVGLVWQWTADMYSDPYNRAVILRGGSVFQPNAHGAQQKRYQPWYFPGRAAAGEWNAKWTGDYYFGPKDYASLYRNTVHAKYLLMTPSLDRAGTIGFRCVADK